MQAKNKKVLTIWRLLWKSTLYRIDKFLNCYFLKGNLNSTRNFTRHCPGGGYDITFNSKKCVVYHISLEIFFFFLIFILFLLRSWIFFVESTSESFRFVCEYFSKRNLISILCNNTDTRIFISWGKFCDR